MNSGGLFACLLKSYKKNSVAINGRRYTFKIVNQYSSESFTWTYAFEESMVTEVKIPK